MGCPWDRSGEGGEVGAEGVGVAPQVAVEAGEEGEGEDEEEGGGEEGGARGPLGRRRAVGGAVGGGRGARIGRSLSWRRWRCCWRSASEASMRAP
jgi:hypothetical protein